MKYILSLLLAITLYSCTSKPGNESKDMIIEVTTQHNIVDTFKINACIVKLHNGDVIYQNDEDKFFGGYTTLASGIYSFKILNYDRN